MYGLIKKNTAQYLVFPLVDADGDFVSGATITGEFNYWEDGTAPQAAFAALTNAEAEIGSTGIYRVQLTTGETNHGYLAFKFTSATSKPQLLLFRTTIGDPANLSVHSAADVWSEASKVITGGVLTTPNDYKATGFSVPNEYDTVIAALQTDLDNPAQYKATGFSVPNEYDTVIAALQTDLDNPDQYKASIAALALEATVAALNNLSSSDVQTVLETNDLDHLIKIAHPTGDPVANSLMDLIMNKDGTQTFARADDSLQGISEGAAGGGASAQEVWEYATGGGRTLSTPADYKATGFSTHSADDVWSVVSRIITGGVLTTPNDYKASITALALEATVAALNNITAGDVWAEVSKVITGGVLTTPSDYKADVTDMATNTNVDANETKIDTMQGNVTSILEDTGTTIMAELLRLRGLSGEFIVAEYTFVGDDNTVIEYWQYDTEANFNTHNKSTGLIGSWILNITFSVNKPTVAKSKRLS